MPEQEPSKIGCPMESRELDRLRSRVHNLSDTVHHHALKLGSHDLMLDVLDKHFETLRGSTATREQLELVSQTTKQHVDNAVAGVAAQVQSVKEDLAPIKRGIYWAVALILGAVILALVGTVLRGGA